ncbi:DNA-binding domain protein [Microcystis phage Me-ZS1]|nr:DNA-binding domain protein [Microcystis phage Me-ZS1]
MEAGTLYQKTQGLLRGRKLLDVHKESGIPFYWLRKFASGSIREPSVNRVQALYEFLTGQKLEL